MKQTLPIGEGCCLFNIKRYLSYVLLINIWIIWLLTNGAQAQTQHQTITGTVISAGDEKPLEGATIKLKQGGRGVLTGKDGKFSLSTPIIKGTLVVTSIGYNVLELAFDQNTQTGLTIRLEPEDNSLDEVQVIGYGQVSKRFNTGSVVTVTSEEIERQPVGSPLAALAGRVPGMTVNQSNGNPGAKFDVRIRGQNSISQGSEPLFLIDGVPYPNNSIGIATLNNANGGQSPFSNINLSDIERIDVLKDADATAIYGSRGANGVVLITTKKGKAGATKVDVSANQGIGKVTKRLDLLNTEQYIAMRKEAFANDGIVPTALNAPDLTLWDTTRYTDWQDYFIGNTANYTNINASISGGSTTTQFLVNGNYNDQSSVYPGHYSDTRGAGSINITHTSSNNKFKAIISSNYGADKNELGSLGAMLFLPPNAPLLFDADGNLNWEENGGKFSNPVTFLKRKSFNETNRFQANLNAQYEVYKGLNLRLTGGYNLLLFDQLNTNPTYAQDPNTSSLTSKADFGNTTEKNWILEPQLEYSHDWRKGSLNVLLGTTLQNDVKDVQAINASDFSNDALLEATDFAKTVTTQTSRIEYRYQAVFGRVNYNYDNKYIINLTGRRDGSSRFGPNRQVSNFGAIGGAWIFSEELKSLENLKWLSFGKIRGSYGITGNDQIGDYQFLDNYGATSTQYQGQIGYIPSRLFNADYSWERNKKLEAALEWGFLGNRILFNVNWFRNRSNNQLINYKLPDQTGFTSILRNFGALVQNTGWEFMLSGTPFNKADLTWQTSLNITIDRNKLLEFPGLEASSYASSLIIGKSLNIIKYLNYMGVDPQTGIYTFEGTSRPADQTFVADFTPNYYGGFSNSFTYKHWNLSFLFQFVKQQGRNYLSSTGGAAAGTQNNLIREIYENRWQQEGDMSKTQRLTSGVGAANTANTNFATYSNGTLQDASFVRLKNVYLSYSLDPAVCRKIGFKEIQLFFQGQNVFTLTPFKGLDPETGAISLPPLQISSLGVNLSL